MVYYCYDSYGRAYNCNGSGWYNWGRWVLLGVIIFAAIVIFFLFSCLSNRRRRKAGRRPMYGTGWVPGAPAYNPNYNSTQRPQYENNYNQPPQGGYYGQNQGYFGGQQTGVQQPGNVYQPPTGPPPGKY